MGHISPHAVKMLVKGRQVTGLTLDMTSEVSFCEACAKVKPTCKTLPKEHGGPHVTNIGEKVGYGKRRGEMGRTFIARESTGQVRG